MLTLRSIQQFALVILLLCKTCLIVYKLKAALKAEPRVAAFYEVLSPALDKEDRT